MSTNLSKLQVIAVVNDKKKNDPAPLNAEPRTQRESAQAHFETLWHKNPEKFNPERCYTERLRINRTIEVMKQYIDLKDKLIVDLGCASGYLAKALRDCGATIHAVDIAKNALIKLKDERGIETFHDYVPSTKLPDYKYDLVICSDLIAHIQTREHRLLINELARLVAPDGYIVLSTPVDIYSEDALDRLLGLIETELTPIGWKFSYHRLIIQLKKYMDLRDRPFFVNLLEKYSRLFFHESGISHAIVIAKKRALI